MNAGLPDAIAPEIEAAMGAPPTPEQWRAIAMPLEPSVIVAGAGSGKTSVMAARVAYLALAALGRVPGAAGVPPGSVLCLTFTNKATEHLRRRVRAALLPLGLPEGEEPTVSNYHGFAQQVLDRHGLLVGVEPGTRLLTPAQRTELAVRVLDEMTFEHNDSTWQPTLIGNILDLADQAANHRVPPERIVSFVEDRLERLREHRSDRPYAAGLERIELARAVERFQRLKQELRVLDFGDQITLALRVAEEFPDVVRDDYRSRFGAVILDEYQDTNVAQADLIAAVFGDGFPVTAVGDPDQNIYAWRGASLYNLLSFTDRFRRADGSPSTKLPLYTNFRSGARILEAADRVIMPLPPAQRPDPDKRLQAHPPLGDGEVRLRRFLDEWSEATWIADRVRAWHDEDPAANPWGSFAILSRKSRLFAPLQEALGERRVPVEVVGLAGLLKTPEVLEVLAYARAVADSAAGVSIARILLGPRYRVSMSDLARLGAWAGVRNRDRRGTLRGDDDERTAFLLSEALEHLDEVASLSEAGRDRLEEFRRELGELGVEARRPVGEFLAEVARRSGLVAEAAAEPSALVADRVRRNLAAFLDQVNAFTPLQGELTLHAFLDYVDTVEDAREEWSPAQPSSEDSVKVMTVHQAKGLEFDTVFVPGLADGLLPDTTLQHNPAERGRSMDFELRGDAAVLPTFGANVTLTAFRDALREQEMFEERRTCYVALTRARRRLVLSGAWWYGEGGKHKGPSAFLEELARWAEETGHAEVDTGPSQPEKGDPNPLSGYQGRLIRDWPGPAPREGEADEVFPEGWRRAALEAARSPDARAALAAGLATEEQLAFERLAAERSVVAENLVRRAVESPGDPRAPEQVSVGGVIEYERCPKRFYWTSVRPLPRFSGPAARVGTRVHAWIESRSSGQATLFESEHAGEGPDLVAEELTGPPGRIERLQQAFLDSRFGRAVPLHAERPFLLSVEGFTVSGRIDAIYGTPEGPWEVVDYKTGRRPPETDALAGLQLDLYALACTDVWGKASRDVTLTYLYLASGEEATRPAGDPAETRSKVAEALRGIGAARFEPAPGDHCRWCDFRPFCDVGRAFVAGAPLAGPGRSAPR